MENFEIDDNEVKRFFEHLNNVENHRIIFSAPYGYGKTTFLKQVANKHNNVLGFSKKFNFFHLYPINYSVASNEDIFQLIKHDILFQLLKMDIEFEKIEFTHLETLGAYYQENKGELLSKLLSFIPKTGNVLTDNLDKVYELFKSYDIFHKKIKTKDEKKDIQKFLNDFHIKIGSIYENDVITCLIRDLLTRLNEQTTIKNILVIDDLDRIDPAHIFRILNIFSAHLDGYNENNKFGFEKVMLVCDLENVRRIFSKTYGKEVDFNGYIDKFYSTTVFEFMNSNLIKQVLLAQIRKNNKNTYSLTADDYRIIVDVLTSLIINGKLNLRRIKHAVDVCVENHSGRYAENTNSEMKSCSLYQVTIYLTSVIGNYENLIASVEELVSLYHNRKGVKDSIIDFEHFYKNYILPVLVLDKHKVIDGQSLIYNYHGSAMGLIWKTKNRVPYVENNPSPHQSISIQKQHMWPDFLDALKTLHHHNLI